MNSSGIGKFAEDFVNYLFLHFRGVFDAFSASLGAVVKLLEDTMLALPFMLVLVTLVVVALWRRGVVFAILLAVPCRPFTSWACGRKPPPRWRW
jgi:glycine betaine/proline transport system permease protein